MRAFSIHHSSLQLNSWCPLDKSAQRESADTTPDIQHNQNHTRNDGKREVFLSAFCQENERYYREERNLRRQIDEAFPIKLVETVRGVGYQLRPPEPR